MKERRSKYLEGKTAIQMLFIWMLAVQSALWVTHGGLKGAELVWTLTVADYIGVIETQKCPRVGHF